jgi:molybdate transport system substrate-binding protein
MFLTFQNARKTTFYRALSLLLLVLAGGHAAVIRADDITLAVASNFITTAKQLAADFEAQSDHRVTLAVGSTGAHYAQIRHGAPFDIFFAADVATPKRLEQENRIIPNSRFTYAQGQLVLWSLDAALVDKAGKLLEPEMLKNNSFAHLAIANPRLAPYGLAAQQTLTSLGVLDALQNKIVRGENVGQTYQFIHSGAAALGFVSLAQVIGQAKNNEGSYWLVPQDLYSPIEQQAVLLTDKKAARDFLNFVRSDAGKAVIQTHGYQVVD